MPWLAKRPDSEHGAIGAMLAVILSAGVIFGMGAIVIDVGALYVEREELVSGADAASWTIAVNCAAKPSDCTPSVQGPVAVTYAKANAKDKQADAQICLTGYACPSWNTTSATCPTVPAPAAGYGSGKSVEVRTTTRTASGSTLLPPSFAQAMTGSSYTGAKVGACARVSWGPPAVADVFALGISKCDFDRMTNGGTTYYGPVGSLLDQVGLFNLIGLPSAGSGNDSAIAQALPLSALGLPLPSCTTPVDLFNPRGYVWLGTPSGAAPSSDCKLRLNIGDRPRSFVLAGLLSANCQAKLRDFRGSTLLVPIFDQISEDILNLAPSYRVVGFAPLVVTGYSSGVIGTLGAVVSLLSGTSLLSALSNALCTLLASCIYGYFTRTVVPQQNPQFGTGDDYGAAIIGRTG